MEKNYKMTKCDLCNLEAKFKVRDKKTKKVLYICEFCEQRTHELIEPLNKEGIEIEDDKNKEESSLVEDDQSNSEDETGALGRLHKVNSTRKVATCRVCKKKIEVGSKCYNQKVDAVPFAKQTKICKDCGQDLIKQGYEIAPKKKK